MSDDVFDTKRFSPEELARLQLMVEQGGPEITIPIRATDLGRLDELGARMQASGRFGQTMSRADAVAAIFQAGLDALEAELG